MDIRLLVIDIVEKLGLIATAALVSVLVPPLRNRLLGIGGQPQDRLVALLLSFCLVMWGAKMGQGWLGVHVNFMAVGILMAARFRVGMMTGLLGGLFYVIRVEPTLTGHVLGPVVVVSTTLMGAVASVLVERVPQSFRTWVFPSACLVQLFGLGLIGIGLALSDPEGLTVFLGGWPALLVQVLANASGITLFAVVARVVLLREENAVALVEARAAADQLALEALRRRLEPHFLFNALNTLRATIRIDPDRARELVLDLSDLYRYLLRHPDDAPLLKEVEHACAYLGIERARLGKDRLHVSTKIPTELAQIAVPALLLQPLVENAVKHGVAAHEGEGEVIVGARQEGDMLVLCVEDRSEGDYVGTIDGGAGIALDTLRARLDKRYGGQASLKLMKRAQGTCAEVRIPLQDD